MCIGLESKEEGGEPKGQRRPTDIAGGGVLLGGGGKSTEGVGVAGALYPMKQTQSNPYSHVPEKVALSHCLSPGPGGTWGVSSSSCSSLNSAGLKWHLKLSPAASLNSSRPFAHTWFLTPLGLAVGVGVRIRGKC